MSAADRIEIVGGRRVTVFTDRGPVSSRRVFSEELGGYISRQLPLREQRAGLSPDEYRDLRAGSRYQHNAETYARSHGIDRAHAMRADAFRDFAINAYSARIAKDWDALEIALRGMGYDVTEEDREKYRKQLEG